MKRVIIIGLDGVPFELIKNLSQKGVMPNVRDILKEGTFLPMKSSLPEISSVAWSSIITGKNPAEHGILGFTDLEPFSYKIKFPSFLDLKEKPFWEKIEGKSVIINVPATYPVKEMQGVHISGFVSIKLEKAVYPKDLIPELQNIGYKIDVSSELAHKNMDLFLEDLKKTLSARIKAYRLLWEKEKNWKIFMLVFTGTDRLMHFLWSAYEDETHPYHQDFLNHFHEIDKAIGEIFEKKEKEDLFLMFSDHGFERLEKEIYLNSLLEKEGFLKREKTGDPFLLGVGEKSLAFCLDPGRIYLNLEGKFPKGYVKENEKEKILKELEMLFSDFKINGKKVIKRIFRKEEIYYGKFLDKAPDLVLLSEEGFDLKGRFNEIQIEKKGIFTGKHKYENAFFFCDKKEKIKNKFNGFSIYEISKIILDYLKE